MVRQVFDDARFAVYGVDPVRSANDCAVQVSTTT
jgi:hypothetical protein